MRPAARPPPLTCGLPVNFPARQRVTPTRRRQSEMKTLVKSRLPSFVVLLAMLLMAAPVSAADDGKAREGAAQVESGAKQIGRGVEDTAKGVGKIGRAHV